MKTVRKPATEGESPELAPAGPPERSGRRQVILLVEDTDADRDLYGSLLWYNGYDVVHATDGDEAVERALEIGPDLILLDITLSGKMNGLEVARRLRQQGFSGPIIALSAHSEQEFGDAARAAGMGAYLEKPIDPFAVAREVMRRLGHAQPDGSGA